MPREEVTQIIEFVETSAAKRLAGEWHHFTMVCCGSYRRGKSHCGDVDLLLARKDGLPHGEFLFKLVEILQEEGLLKETLQLMSEPSEKGTQTYMGICKLPSGSLYRRIDIKVSKVHPDLPSQMSRFCFALLHGV